LGDVLGKKGERKEICAQRFKKGEKELAKNKKTFFILKNFSLKLGGKKRTSWKSEKEGSIALRGDS